MVDVIGPSNDYAVDLFTGTTGVAIGSPWTYHTAQPGTLTYESNRARATSSTTTLSYHSGVAAFANGVVKADILFTTGSGFTGGVVGRLDTSAATFYGARMNNSGALELVKSIAGTVTVIGTYTVSLANNTSIKVQLRMNGTSIRVYGNDVRRIDVTDSSITAAGRAGIRITGGGTSTTGIHIDGWKASDLDVPLPTDVFTGYARDVYCDFSDMVDLPEGSFYPVTSGSDTGLFDPASPGGAAITTSGAAFATIAKGKSDGPIPNETLSDYDQSTLSVASGIFRGRMHWVSGRGKAPALKPRYLAGDHNFAALPRVRMRWRKSSTGTTPVGWGGIPIEVIGNSTSWAAGGGEYGLSEGNFVAPETPGSPLGIWVRPANHLPSPNSYATFYRADTAGVADVDNTHWHTGEILPCNDDGTPGRMRALIDGVVVYDSNSAGGSTNAPTLTDMYGVLMQCGKPGTPSSDSEAVIEIAWFTIELPTTNLKRWDPNGTDGTDVAASGTTLASVNKVGTGTMKYDATAGFNRGYAIGAELQSPVDTDQTNVIMTTTAAATATCYAYFKIITLPASGAAIPFMDLRSSTANLIRAAIAPSGLLTCQNSAGGSPGGALAGTLATLTVGTIYRVGLTVDPGVATVTPFDGIGSLTLWDNSDTVLFTASISNGNFGTTVPSTIRFGDASTAAGQGAGLVIKFSQLAINTHATVIPTIPAVAQLVAPPATVGNFPRIMVSGAWV